MLFSSSSFLSEKSFPSCVSNFSSSSSDTVLTVSSECLFLFESGFQLVGSGNLTPQRFPRLGVVHADIGVFQKDSFGGTLRINWRRIKY